MRARRDRGQPGAEGVVGDLELGEPGARAPAPAQTQPDHPAAQPLLLGAPRPLDVGRVRRGGRHAQGAPP